MSNNEGWIPHDGDDLPRDLGEYNGIAWRPHKNADGQEATTAPSQEGHAAGPACSAPDSVALNTRHPHCHEAADAFWKYWRENGETHKRGYYESTWGAINSALRVVGVVLPLETCEKCGMDLVLGCQVCAAGWPSKLSDIEQARRDALTPDEALIEEIVNKYITQGYRCAVEGAIREYIRRSAGKEKL